MYILVYGSARQRSQKNHQQFGPDAAALAAAPGGPVDAGPGPTCISMPGMLEGAIANGLADPAAPMSPSASRRRGVADIKRSEAAVSRGSPAALIASYKRARHARQ